MKDVVRLFVLRHAESRGNTGEEPDIDPPLSALGMKQARALAPLFAPVVFDQIFLSPLQRTRQTFVAAGLRGQRMVMDSRLVEFRDPGIYARQVLPYAPELPGVQPDRHQAWEIPFGKRIREFMQDAAQLPPGRYLAVCHGGTAHGMLNDVCRPPECKEDDSLQQAAPGLRNAAWSAFVLRPDRIGDEVLFWNRDVDVRDLA